MSDAKSFYSTSSSVPSILHVSFSDPKGSLGAQLVNCDKKATSEMFVPGYALVGRLLEGDTAAKQAGVQIGDVLVAVNGCGFRRFAPDYKKSDAIKLSDLEVVLNHAVVEPGSGYDMLLAKIKAMKAASVDGGDSMVLSMERWGWDAQPNSWGRFLAARDENVPDAMMMMQQHESWRTATFPITLNTPGLQKILREKAVSEIDVEFLSEFPPTVYVNYGKLLEMQTAGEITADDVVSAFVM